MTDKLLDMTVRELLEEYCIVMSLECDYIYGIAKYDDVNKIDKEYDLEDYVSFSVESLIDDRLEFEDELLDYSKLECIAENLGFKKKGDNNE